MAFRATIELFQELQYMNVSPWPIAILEDFFMKYMQSLGQHYTPNDLVGSNFCNSFLKCLICQNCETTNQSTKSCYNIV